MTQKLWHGFVITLLLVSIAYSGTQIYSFLTNPCNIPISIYISQIDSRFGLSESEAESILSEAIESWENVSERDLFIQNDPSAKGSIRLIFTYDDRQKNAEVLNELDSVLEADKAEYNELKALYDLKKASYIELVDEYDREVSQNGRGSRANELAERINALVDELNSLSERINILVGTTNQNIDAFNEIQESQGEEFDQGVYTSSESGRSITIYQFKSARDLRDVLIHELGHALGLQHSEEEDSVMYYLNTGPHQKILSSDIASLRSQCKL